MFRVFVVEEILLGHSRSKWVTFIGFIIYKLRATTTRCLFPSFRVVVPMTSRRVPVPNPKFARSSSDDDDDDDDTRAAAAIKSSSNTTNGRTTQQVHPSSHKGSKQTHKATKIKEKRAKKTPLVEALVVATTKNGNHHQNASGKKTEKDAEDPLVQPSKILIPQNGDDGPKKWRLADQRRCALNVITRKASLNHHHHRSVVVSRASKKKTRRSRACPFGGRFWSSTERCCWDWSRR